MFSENINILLADDDKDDCNFFKEALKELHLLTNLTTVHDGEQLMHLLTKKITDLPDVIFLDLNMPRKSGYECLSEIKLTKNLNSLPVIIFSTSLDPEIINLLYKSGAKHYIRKPAQFSNLKKILHHALTIIQNNSSQTGKEKFVLSL